MKEKGQTGLEYLLMIGGVVLLVAVTIMVVTATGGIGTNTAYNAQNKAGEEVEEFEGPKAKFSAVPTSADAPPLEVTFTDSSTVPAGSSIVSWIWDFGDGEDFDGQAPLPHEYTDYGNFLVTLEITDNGGRKSYADELISIIPPDTPPDANFTYRQESSAVKTINFFDDSNSGSPSGNDLDDAIVEWNWDFGDDVNSTEQNPAHQYENYYEGGITVILTVKDRRGGESTVSGNVPVLGVCGNGIAEPNDECALEYDFSNPENPEAEPGCNCFLAERTECEDCSHLGQGAKCCGPTTEIPGQCIVASKNCVLSGQ